MAGSLEYDKKKGCPPGFHKRSSYTSTRGHRVPPRCVKAQTVYAETRKNYSRRMLEKQEHRLKSIHNLSSSTRKLHCPKGKVSRHGYVRRFGKTIMKKGYTVKRSEGKEYRIYPEKKSVYVKASCVKDMGDPHVKTPDPGNRIGTLRKGELKKHGYVYNKSETDRHSALKKAIQEFGTLGVYHKLDAVAKLSKFSVPEASKIFKEDREWLKSHYEF
jgi:hypothetical protein